MKRIDRQMNSQPRRRCGAAMVFALMALLLTSLMIAGLLRTVSMSHRQLKREEFGLQANLLADAGCARAIAKLRADPKFINEEWIIPSTQLQPERSAVVTLSVTHNEQKTNERTVSVTATYPVDQPDLVRVTRTITVQTTP